MGILYIVATPIGNLEDITLRALRILKEVDLIACEDTRTTQKLLRTYKIFKPLTSYHQHSSLKKQKFLLEKLKKGKKIALVSEAGTPAISDPGVKLVQSALKEGIKIIPIPGPSAFVCALSVAGFSVAKFIFLGFLPKKKKRQKILQEITNSPYPIVFYESCFRILKTLEELNNIIPERETVVLRELTKKFETHYRGSLSQVITQIKKDVIKGEYVVVLRGKKSK